MLTLKTIHNKLKEIKIPLDLVKQEGYFYFIYDNKEKNIFETHSIYVVKLNQLSLDTWIEIAQNFYYEIMEKYE